MAVGDWSLALSRPSDLPPSQNVSQHSSAPSIACIRQPFHVVNICASPSDASLSEHPRDHRPFTHADPMGSSSAHREALRSRCHPGPERRQDDCTAGLNSYTGPFTRLDVKQGFVMDVGPVHFRSRTPFLRRSRISSSHHPPSFRDPMNLGQVPSSTTAHPHTSHTALTPSLPVPLTR